MWSLFWDGKSFVVTNISDGFQVEIEMPNLASTLDSLGDSEEAQKMFLSHANYAMATAEQQYANRAKAWLN